MRTAVWSYSKSLGVSKDFPVSLQTASQHDPLPILPLPPGKAMHRECHKSAKLFCYAFLCARWKAGLSNASCTIHRETHEVENSTSVK